MSTPDPRFDVQFVPRLLLPQLPTTADPMALLRTQVMSPFRDWYEVAGNHGVGNACVAVTVVSRLAEPVVAVNLHRPKGYVAGQPRVLVGGQEIPPEGMLQGHYGWIDPACSAGLVSIGSWLVHDGTDANIPDGAGLVLHLRCMTSKVDILVGSYSAERSFGDGLGGWNPYYVGLHEAGDLPDRPSESDYQDVYDKDIAPGGSDDRSGTSAARTVSYLARSPQGRNECLQHVLLILGPEPIAADWDVTPAPPAPSAGQVAARTMATGTGSAPPASGVANLEPIVPGVYYTVSSTQDPNLVLSVVNASTADRAEVILYPPHGGQEQQWRFEPVPGGGYRIVARHSGKCLDVTGASPDGGVPVIQYTPTGGDNQRWTRAASDTGTSFTLTAAHSGKLLDASGGASTQTPLIQYPANGAANQLWTIAPV